MGYLKSEQAYVCQLIARICEIHNLRQIVKDCGAVEVCLHILKSYEIIRFDHDILTPLMLVFERMARFPGVDDLIAKSDALSQFMKISKLNSPCAEGARQVLRLMREQVSALQIQLVLSNFIGRTRARRKRAADFARAKKAREDAADTKKKVEELAAQVVDAEKRLGRI
jgi:hypothetical protein